MASVRRILLAFSLFTPCVAHGQAIVTSSAPLSSSVTVYRDPDRGEGRINPQWPNGYALVSEKRRITLPAGESIIRFEGVADGMLAVSAVVTGLPGGVSEKNRDGRLLSPASLLDGSLGNRVHLRRTNRQTGKVSEGDVIIRSGPNNAVVLQTAEGVEALRCSGLPETLVYDAVPEGLSAKPTFSVMTESAQATTVDVTLTYLATGFDWGASYVAKVAEDGKTLDLFAWLTLANGNSANFDAAQLLAVAGRPNRQSNYDALVARAPSPVLNLKCWPMDGTSTNDKWRLLYPREYYSRPDMMERFQAVPIAMSAVSDIVVTSQKRIAQQEDLGDLKLYRVPMPVDIASNGLKQVMLLERAHVPFTTFYAAEIAPYAISEESRPLSRMLRMQNKEKDGLGLPLPSGAAVVSQTRGDSELLLADATMRDRAVGEKVELSAGESDQVRYVFTDLDDDRADYESYRVALTNATDRPAAVEIKLGLNDDTAIARSTTKLVRQDGKWMWKVTVPANGTSSLDFTTKD